jgi:hypothetical protein
MDKASRCIPISSTSSRASRSRRPNAFKRQRAVEAAKQAGIANPVELILEVRKVAEKAGGIRHLKKLVDLLAE